MKISMKETRGNEKGMMLVVVMLLLLMLSLIGIASITTSTSDMTVAGNELDQTGAFYAAESGLERAAAAITTSFETTGTPPDPLPTATQTEGGFQYTYSTAANGGTVQTTLTDGAYRGLYGLVRKFNVTSTGKDNSGESSITLNMAMQDALIPLFQFAVFYQNDLEVCPGPNMTLGGRVHSNSNIYLASENNIYIDGYLTSAGDVFHSRKPGSGLSTPNGNVYIKDDASAYQNMKNNDNTWLDSRSSNWVDGSLGRWDGQVEDSNHGITELEMPVVTDGPATDLIDPAAGNNDSYENKAGLKILDTGVFYLSGTSWTNITSQLPSGTIVTREFYDAREGKYVTSKDIDIGKLNTSGYYPSNGIIYASTTTTSGKVPGVRLRNAATLPRATTIATNNPLYTLGNFNTTSKKPASILCDALTALSGNWNDSNGNKSLSNRIATATTINASFITGTDETGAGGHDYNGGLENVIRFLEDWSSKSLTWRGSAVSLYYSRQARGEWGGDSYSPPDRNWGFDTDLLNIANLPPGTPMVNIVQRTQWYQTFSQAH